MDLCIDGDDLVSDSGLNTAVLLSIFTDRRAVDGEPVPGAVEDRRGWWADEFLVEPGDRMGSRRWLLERAAIRAGLADADRGYLEESIAWMIGDRVARSVSVETEIVGARLSARVEVVRPDGEELEFRFAHVWDAIEAAG